MTLLSFSSVMSTIGSVLIAVLILLVMITVHEFGHYIAGKALKFRINEFAIGFGPGLFRHTSKKTGEVFSVRLLPLGGFCAFEGEDGDEDEENEISENAFTRKAPWKRIIVLLAGPLMNYVLAVFLIIISMFAFGQMVFRVDGIVTEDVPQQYLEYSLEDGDLILQAVGSERQKRGRESKFSRVQGRRGKGNRGNAPRGLFFQKFRRRFRALESLGSGYQREQLL